MLEISVEKVCHIIIKGREFDVKVAAADPDPGSNAADEDMRGVLEDTIFDPVRDELAAFISGLNVDERADLVALTWLGRGTYESFEAAREEAERNLSHGTADYLLGIPLLPDYLEAGLAEMGFEGDVFEMGRI